MCKLTLGYGIFKNKLNYEFLHWVSKKNIETAIFFASFLTGALEVILDLGFFSS
jgi:hypothetical protein